MVLPQPIKLTTKSSSLGPGVVLAQSWFNFLKLKNATITAFDKEEKNARLKQMGVSETYDYRQINYIDQDVTYDYVFDLNCVFKLRDVLKTVKRKGSFIMLGGTPKNIIKILLFGWVLSKIYNKKITMGKYETNRHEDLNTLGELLLNQEITPIIDTIIPLEKTIQGLQSLQAGYIKGKIVIAFEKV